VGKRWTWVAWSMLTIYLVGIGVGFPLMVANGEFQQDPAGQASLLLAFTAFMVMGAVIVAHRPGNATGFFAWQYAEYAYITRGSPLPGAMLSAWYNNWFWYPTIILATVFHPLGVSHRPAVVDPLASCGLADSRHHRDGRCPHCLRTDPRPRGAH
jgi:hypothetical protein